MSYRRGSDATVSRISEGTQLDGALLRSLGEAGISPGKRVRITWAEEALHVLHEDATVRLNRETAAGIFVVPERPTAGVRWFPALDMTDST